MFDHPYQEFNSKRALLHHLRVDHGLDVDDLPSYYYRQEMVSLEEGRLILLHSALLADHEEYHAELAKQREKARRREGRPEDLGV